MDILEDIERGNKGFGSTGLSSVTTAPTVKGPIKCCDEPEKVFRKFVGYDRVILEFCCEKDSVVGQETKYS